MILSFVLMFACGLFTKFTDNLIDEPFKSKWSWLQFLTGAIYGLLAGYLASNSTEFATLIIAITIGVLIAGKIDAKAHQLAVAIIFAFFAFFGLPTVDFFLMAGFVVLGFLDEVFNDLMDKAREKGKKVNKVLQSVISARLSLEIGALVFGFVSGNYIYFIAIFLFDLAYNIVDKTMPHFMEKFDADYGPQLSLDLYKCSQKRLDDKKFVKKLLNEFPEKIGMRKISEPHVIEYRPEKKEEGGLSGFVIIAESHITIHTYPIKELAKIDIVSCKEFDHGKAVSILKKAFKAKESEYKNLYRGKHYPSDERKATRIMKKERSTKTN